MYSECGMIMCPGYLLLLCRLFSSIHCLFENGLLPQPTKGNNEDRGWWHDQVGTETVCR